MNFISEVLTLILLKTVFGVKLGELFEEKPPPDPFVEEDFEKLHHTSSPNTNPFNGIVGSNNPLSSLIGGLNPSNGQPGSGNPLSSLIGGLNGPKPQHAVSSDPLSALFGGLNPLKGSAGSGHPLFGGTNAQGQPGSLNLLDLLKLGTNPLSGLLGGGSGGSPFDALTGGSDINAPAGSANPLQSLTRSIVGPLKNLLTAPGGPLDPAKGKNPLSSILGGADNPFGALLGPTNTNKGPHTPVNVPTTPESETTIEIRDPLTSFFILKEFDELSPDFHKLFNASKAALSHNDTCRKMEIYELRKAFGDFLPHLTALGGGKDMLEQVEQCQNKKRYGSWKALKSLLQRLDDDELSKPDQYACRKGIKLETIRCNHSIRILCTILNGESGLTHDELLPHIKRLVENSSKTQTAAEACKSVSQLLNIHSDKMVTEEERNAVLHIL